MDTGAQVSIITLTHSDCLCKRVRFTLSAVNGSTIMIYGRSLTLGLRRTYCWIFIIADVSKQLLGADFLHFGLLVDMAHRKLVDTRTHLSIHGIVTEGTFPSPTTTIPSHTSLLILTLRISGPHPDSQLSRPPLSNTLHISVQLSSRVRRLSPKKLQIARKGFKHMIELGII